MNRKKRILKGIKSIEKQIKLHEEKLKKTRITGNWGLEGYYEKEIKAKKKDIEKKKKSLEK